MDCNVPKNLQSPISNLQSPSHKSAFTLVELSIVLVIIGLIVGGVLTGRDLIRAAELRSTTAQLQQIITGVMTFKLKYNALPGDMPDATQIWGSEAVCPYTPANTVPHTVTCNGNGDGVIGGYGTASNPEEMRFWQHLANADLISGKYTGIFSEGNSSGAWHNEFDVNIPRAAISGSGFSREKSDVAVILGIGYWQAPYKYGSSMIFFGTQTCQAFNNCPALTPKEQFLLDSKIDDGLPASGKIVSIRGNWGFEPNCATSIDPTIAVYKTSLDSIECSFIYSADF